MLIAASESDREGQRRVAAFREELQKLGWSESTNIRIDTRWVAPGDTASIQRYAKELVSLQPDLVFSYTTPPTAALLQETRGIPIIFTGVSDPIGGGFVESFPRPGGNATGFMTYEYSMSGKWLELLKEIAPRVTRAAVLRDPAVASGIGQFGAVQIVAPSFGVELIPVDVRDADEIERAVAAIARGSNGGVIVTASALPTAHRELIVTLAARHKLPAVYFGRFFVTAGGLISYAPDPIDQYRHAAGYVDRILKGEKPADLPVQAPTKYELVINLKTAKALGLDIPARVLARADEVIEYEFITLLGGAAAGWPLATHAQPSGRARKVGVLMPFAENDPEGVRELAAFTGQLRQLGWIEGQNARIEHRWAAGESDRMQTLARELVEWSADVVVANSSPLLRAVQRHRHGVATVFVVVSEPVAQGFVQSLARPGGNITGFTNLEPSFGPKWLEVLKEIAPRVSRVALIFNPRTAPYAALFAASAQTAAHEFATELSVERVDDLAHVEAVMAKLIGDPQGGLEGGSKMPTLAVQLAIGDYAKWRPVFDKHKSLRDKAGLTNVRVYRDADNPTEVIVWGETSDVAKVRGSASSEWRDA
jgi:putative ABC transport system substrate-binding protein